MIKNIWFINEVCILWTSFEGWILSLFSMFIVMCPHAPHTPKVGISQEKKRQGNPPACLTIRWSSSMNGEQFNSVEGLKNEVNWRTLNFLWNKHLCGFQNLLSGLFVRNKNAFLAKLEKNDHHLNHWTLQKRINWLRYQRTRDSDHIFLQTLYCTVLYV